IPPTPHCAALRAAQPAPPAARTISPARRAARPNLQSPLSESLRPSAPSVVQSCPHPPVFRRTPAPRKAQRPCMPALKRLRHRNPPLILIRLAAVAHPVVANREPFLFHAQPAVLQ